MIRKVLRVGDVRLTRIALPVQQFGTPALNKLVLDLFDTLRALKGLGLAAPQIGVGQRVIVVRDTAAPADQRHLALVNPVLTPLTDETTLAAESCLSVPGRWGDVRRCARVRYVATDAEGRLLTRDVDGLLARVLQHEVDHLEGVLFPQRMAGAAPWK